MAQHAVFLVKEEDPDRQIESYLVQVFVYRKFYEWIEAEKNDHNIRNNCDIGSRSTGQRTNRKHGGQVEGSRPFLRGVPAHDACTLLEVSQLATAF